MSSPAMFTRAIRHGPAAARSSRAISRCTPACRPGLPSACVPSSSLSSSYSPRSSQPTRSISSNATIKRNPYHHHRVLTVLDDPSSSPRQPPEFVPDTSIAVLRTVPDVHQWTAAACNSTTHPPQDAGLALIPTMGALHQGHLDLIREAARRGHDKIVVSIFVNPAQFGVSEDLESYPKTWDSDCAVLAQLYPELDAAVREALPGATQPLKMAIFAPTTAEMYPSGFPGQEVDSTGSFVTITPVGELLEGKTRPTFFRGVATVCMKIFNIVLPSRVFFGQKDVQQTVVIRRMVRDFRMPIDVAVCPTVREAGDGLALSSRNVYLGTRRRKVAPVLINALRAAEATYTEEDVLDAGDIVRAALKVILNTMEEQSRLSTKEGVMFELDYISLADPDTMEEIDEVDPAKGAILSGAIKMLPLFETQEGEDLGHNNGPPVRLIDNIILPPKV